MAYRNYVRTSTSFDGSTQEPDKNYKQNGFVFTTNDINPVGLFTPSSIGRQDVASIARLMLQGTVNPLTDYFAVVDSIGQTRFTVSASITTSGWLFLGPQDKLKIFSPNATKVDILVLDLNDLNILDIINSDAQNISKEIREQTQSVIWAPDGSGTATNFLEAYSQAITKTIPTTVYLNRKSNLEPQLIIPSGIWDVQYMNATTFMYGNPEINQLVLEDGAILLNPSEIVRSCSIKSVSNSPVIQFTLDPSLPPVIFIGLGAVILNDGTSPAYISPDNSFTVLALDGGSVAPGINSQPIIQLGAGAFCLLRAQSGAAVVNTTITGPIGSVTVLSHDGSIKFPITLPGFLGTFLNKPLGMNGGAGPTTFRPDTSDPGDLPSVGCYYFDTTLGYTINWNGLIWVDSTGAAV